MTKLVVGEELLLAHCPERLFPSNVIKELINNDRIISGTSSKAINKATRIYRSFSKGRIIVSDIKTTELVKLVENVFRDVNIALANEIAMICESLGLDVEELIGLANSHPRVNILKPGPGVGGTCVPKDPVLLSNICKKLGLKTRLIDAARYVNTDMPLHFSKRIISRLKKGSKILVLGLAYKANVNDCRDSPSEAIIRTLKSRGMKVLAHDPLVERFKGVTLLKNLKTDFKFDAIVLVTDHDEFKKMSVKKLKSLCKKNGLIADGRRMWQKQAIEGLGLKYIGIGI
jgi:UDP-N-acetyl-D-mannosaminuronic acid dehydrogenase